MRREPRGGAAGADAAAIAAYDGHGRRGARPVCHRRVLPAGQVAAQGSGTPLVHRLCQRLSVCVLPGYQTWLICDVVVVCVPWQDSLEAVWSVMPLISILLDRFRALTSTDTQMVPPLTSRRCPLSVWWRSSFVLEIRRCDDSACIRRLRRHFTSGDPRGLSNMSTSSIQPHSPN